MQCQADWIVSDIAGKAENLSRGFLCGGVDCPWLLPSAIPEKEMTSMHT